MKKNLLLFIGSFALLSGYSQLVITSGATLKIQPGAFIKCTGDVQNLAGGSISNDGKLEVQGSFTNSGTYNTATGDDSLIMSGGTGGIVNLNGGGSTISFLTISKTSAADIVRLTGTTLVGTKLDFTSGTFTTDPIANPTFVLQSPSTAVYSFAPGMEIVGSVRRTGWSNGPTIVFNQPNMLVTTAGGVTPTNFTVTMIPQSASGDPTQVEREVKRKFQFVQTGGSGFTANIRFPYIAGELNTNTEANLVPWELIGAEWNGRLTPVVRDAANDWVSTTGIAATSLVNEWKLADPRYTINATVYLKGAWVAGPNMTIALRTAGLIPLNQPFNTTPFTYTGTESVGAIPVNVTDWILVELRKPASGQPIDALSSTIIGRKAGFLLNTGVPVDLDGSTPIAFDINKQGASFIVIRHNNHLAAMSNSVPSNVTGSFANNFSILGNVYKNPGNPSQPVDLLPSSALFGLWAGDANKSGTINGGDVTVIKNDVALGATGYLLTDVNLTASINGGDVTVAKNTVAVGGGGSVGARIMKKIMSHLPGTAIENE